LKKELVAITGAVVLVVVPFLRLEAAAQAAAAVEEEGR
jgi:hypothetical protein